MCNKMFGGIIQQVMYNNIPGSIKIWKEKKLRLKGSIIFLNNVKD